MAGQLIGEVCIPSELVVPSKPSSSSQPQMKGQLILSGTKLYFHNGTTYELVTSV